MSFANISFVGAPSPPTITNQMPLNMFGGAFHEMPQISLPDVPDFSNLPTLTVPDIPDPLPDPLPDPPQVDPPAHTPLYTPLSTQPNRYFTTPTVRNGSGNGSGLGTRMQRETFEPTAVDVKWFTPQNILIGIVFIGGSYYLIQPKKRR